MSQQSQQQAPPTLITGSYDRSLRVWTDNSPNRSLPFNTSQVNCTAISNEGRFFAAGGHGVIRVYEFGALQGPHVSNENAPPPTPAQQQAAANAAAQQQQQQQQGGVPPQQNNNNQQAVVPPPQPTVVDSNFTSLHFVLITTTTTTNENTATAVEGQQQPAATEQQQQQQVLVSTSEDGFLRIWEAKGQALTISQQSASVGCPLLCSCVTQNTYTTYMNNKNQQQAATSASPLMLFAGSQAGILFGWNLQQNNNQNQNQQVIHNQQPTMRVLVNRYPISAISCMSDWYNQNQNGMIVASTTRGVVMSFWYDVDAVAKGQLSMTHQQSNISKHKQQIIASATSNNNKNNNQNDGNNNNNIDGKQSVLSGGTTTLYQTQQNLQQQNQQNNNNNARGVDQQTLKNSDALYRGGDTNTNAGNNNNYTGSDSSSHVFDGNVVPINQVAVPPTIFNFSSIFKAHNKYIVKNTLSPSCYLQSPSPSNHLLFLLATASADCTVKLWRLPPAWSSFNGTTSQQQHNSEMLATITTSEDLNVGIMTGEASIKRALMFSSSHAAGSATSTSTNSADKSVGSPTGTGSNNNANNTSQQQNMTECCYWNLECTIPHQRWVWDVVFSSRNPIQQQQHGNNSNNTVTTSVITLFTASSENAAWSWNITFSNKNAILGGGTTTSSSKQQQEKKNSSSNSSHPLVVTTMAKTFQYTGHQKPVTCLSLYERL